MATKSLSSLKKTLPPLRTVAMGLSGTFVCDHEVNIEVPYSKKHLLPNYNKRDEDGKWIPEWPDAKGLRNYFIRRLIFEICFEIFLLYITTFGIIYACQMSFKTVPFGAILFIVVMDHIAIVCGVVIYKGEQRYIKRVPSL